MLSYTAAEVEASRQETLFRLFGDVLVQEEGYSEGDVLVEPSDYTPLTPGYHEAVHTAKIVANLIDNELLDHPSVALNSQAYVMAMAAHTALVNLHMTLMDAEEASLED